MPRGRWGVRYELWLQTLAFEEPAAQAAFDHLMGAASVRAAQLAAIEREIEAAALCGAARRAGGAPARLPRHRHAHRGHRSLTETCDFRRFPSAGGYMAFTGLVPREHSSGAGRQAGLDHQGRQRARAARARRGRLGLPPPARGARQAGRASGGPISPPGSMRRYWVRTLWTSSPR